MSTAILVCGMHRSGTSATTGALRLAGVELGGELLGPGDDNPKGYWENTRAVAIHEQLLSSLDMAWDDVRDLPGGWDTGAAAAEAMSQIHALIDAEFGSAPLWAIKDPRLCRFLPLWKRVLSDRGVRGVALLVARHPDEVAASISKRNGWKEAVGKLLWMRYVLEAEAHTRDMDRAVITYESLLADPVEALWRAAGRIGVVLPEPAEAQMQAFRQFVDTGDRHHESSASADATGFEAALNSAYLSLARIEGGVDAWPEFHRAAAAATDSLARFSSDIEGLAAMSRRWQARHADTEVELAKARSDFNAQVRWSEEAVERQQKLQLELEAERARSGAVVSLGQAQQALLEGVQQLLRKADENKALAEEVQALRESLGSERLRSETLELDARRVSLDLAGTRTSLDAERSRAESLEAEVARMSSESSGLRSRITELEGMELRLTEVIQALRDENSTLAKWGQEIELQLRSIEQSISWRITQPARAAMRRFRRVEKP